MDKEKKSPVKIGSEMQTGVQNDSKSREERSQYLFNDSCNPGTGLRASSTKSHWTP